MSCSACGAVAHAGASRCPVCGRDYGGAIQVTAGLLTPVSHPLGDDGETGSIVVDPDRTLTGGPASMADGETGAGETPIEGETGAGETPTGSPATYDSITTRVSSSDEAPSL